MSKSVTLTFGEPELPPPPAPAPSKPADPAAMTRDERTSANWQTLFVGWVVGLPSLLAIGFVVIVDLHYAWLYTDDARSWLLLSAGLVTVTLFCAGLPIAAGLTHETSPIVARAAGIFWLVCVAANLGIMGYFTMTSPAPAPVSVQQVQSEEARQGIAEIADRRADIASAEAHRDRWHEETRVWYANAKAQLARLERAHGVPSSSSAARAPAGHGLDLAGVALLMIVGSAIGLAISASSLAAILTEKAATVRVETEAAPASGPMPLPAFPAPAAPDAFEAWADDAVSKASGGSIRSSDAYATYSRWCEHNDFGRPMDPRAFGMKLAAYLKDSFGVAGRHSGAQGGTVYDGVALSAAQANGYANGAAHP